MLVLNLYFPREPRISSSLSSELVSSFLCNGHFSRATIVPMLLLHFDLGIQPGDRYRPCMVGLLRPES